MPLPPIIPGRKPEAISAVLLPFTPAGEPDEAAFRTLVSRTLAAGITPSVNMDTGYANLITDAQRRRVLAITRELAAGREFVAGAFIEGRTGDPTALYHEQVREITSFGGTPIIFQSTGMRAMDDDALIALYAELGRAAGRILAFELGQMFLPFGRIYPADIAERLMNIPEVSGMKHSSLSRLEELERLALKNRVRPEFRVYTGNDLAVDMIMYGSDYLLGLSAFHPEAFALRDRLWAAQHPAFFELNDLIQYLGFFAFRPPVPVYKHTAAQFLKCRGILACDAPHPQGGRRPDSDLPILQDIADRLGVLVERFTPLVPAT